MSSRVTPVGAAAALLGLPGLTAGRWSPNHRWDGALSEHARAFGEAHPDWVAVLRILTDVAATIPFLAAGLALTGTGPGRRQRIPTSGGRASGGPARRTRRPR